MLPELSPAQERLLINLADPEAPADWGKDVSAGDLMALLANAEFHGVLPIVLRKLRERGDARLPQNAALQRRLSELRDDATIATGQSMLLQYHGDRIMKALAAKGVPARIVKGPVFARRLYRQLADRPFTDIDILVDPASIDEANRTIAECGFVLGRGEAESHAL